MKNFLELIRNCLTDVREIMPWDLEERLTENPDLLVVDVREPDEFAAMHIEGSINVPRGILESAANGTTRRPFRSSSWPASGRSLSSAAPAIAVCSRPIPCRCSGTNMSPRSRPACAAGRITSSHWWMARAGPWTSTTPMSTSPPSCGPSSGVRRTPIKRRFPRSAPTLGDSTPVVLRMTAQAGDPR